MTPETASTRVRELGESFAAAIEAMSAEALHARSAPDAWSAAEIAGHASEFPVTFATQAVALAKTPGLRLGRNLDDPGRLAAAARLGDATPERAANVMREAAAESARLVASIPEEGWSATGVRVMNGERFSVGQVVEELIIGHMESHLRQLRA